MVDADRVARALQSEDRRFAAMAASDLVMLDDALADDLHYTHANGMVEDKADFIARIADGRRRYEAVRVVHRRVDPQPGFVAVFGQVDVEVMRPVGRLSNRLDYTAIYRDRDARLYAWSAVFSYRDEQ